MKKRMLACLLALLFTLTLLPAVSLAADPAVVITTYGGGSVEVFYEGPQADVIAASYDNGRMTASETKTGVTEGKLTFALPEADAYRVFALDSVTKAPLCESGLEADASRLIVYESTDQPLPMMSDNMAHATSSAVDAYVEASMLLEELMQLDITDIHMPVRPDDEHAVDMESEEALAARAKYEDTLDKLRRAQKAWDQVLKAGAVLDAAAEQEIAALQSAGAQPVLQAASQDEQLAWAKSLTAHYDALKGANRIAQLAKDMGCDAHRAYASLVMAQNILQGHYANEEGDNAEFWEKTMIATKTGAKIGLFICATIATGGATATAPAGYVTVGEAAGIVLGGVDCTIDATSSTCKILLGPDNKVVKAYDDAMKPVTDTLMIYSIVTGGGSSAGEKMSCIFDAGNRAKELYDQFTVKKDKDGNLVVDVTTVKTSDGQAAQDVIDKELDGGTGFAGQGTEMTPEEAVKDFTDKVDSGDDWLDVLIHELGLDDKSLMDLMRDFDEKVREQIDEDNKDEDDDDGGGGGGGDTGGGGGGGDPDGGPPEEPKIIRNYYEETGTLSSEIAVDKKGRELWSKYYTKSGLVSREDVFSAGPEEGTRILTRKFYYNNEWDLEETGGVTDVLKTVQQYLEDANGTKEYYGNWYGYYPDGTLSGWSTGVGDMHDQAYHREEYAKNGWLSTVYEVDPANPKHVTRFLYYTDPHYNGCPYFTAGHLWEIREGIQDNTYPGGWRETYVYDKWEVREWPSDAYDWVWQYYDYLGVNQSEVIPMN